MTMKTTKLSVEDKLSKAKISAVRDFPFFGLIVMACEFVEDPGCGTMWADGRRVGYDPAFVEGCEPAELSWALMHEALHNAFGHINRLGNRHPDIHNYATDYWINGRLRVAIETKKGGHNGAALSIREVDLARVLKNPKANILVDVERWGEQSSDEIYAALVKELLNKDQGMNSVKQKQQQKQKGQPGGSGGGTPGQGDGESDSDGTEQPDAGKGSRAWNDPLDQNQGMGGDLNYKKAKEAGNTDSAKAKENAEYWKGQVATAAMTSRKQGQLPAGFDRFIDQLLNPTVPWQEQLSPFIQPMPADYAFHIPDRRFLEEDFLLPDFTGEYLKVMVAVDTSGSVSAKELTQYISDTTAILRSFERVEGWFVGCDAHVHDFHKIGPEDPVPSKIGGGGGTSFIPVFDLIKQEEIEPNVLVYFTDGYGSFPSEEPEFPVVWIIVNSDVTPPFGHIIKVSSN